MEETITQKEKLSGASLFKEIQEVALSYYDTYSRYTSGMHWTQKIGEVRIQNGKYAGSMAFYSRSKMITVTKDNLIKVQNIPEKDGFVYRFQLEGNQVILTIHIGYDNDDIVIRGQEAEQKLGKLDILSFIQKVKRKHESLEQYLERCALRTLTLDDIPSI